MEGISFFTAKVMHARLFPRKNAFTYGVYYLAFPLSRLEALADGWRFGLNRAGLLSFHEKDHGPQDGSPLRSWIAGILQRWHIPADGEIVLVTMPRVMGYGFNPVSFWLCLDKMGALRAVLAEVHNTYGDAHSYLCLHEDRRPILAGDVLDAGKVFHVSPFLERKGRYRFRFDYRPKEARLCVWIDYGNEEGKLQLLTSITGRLEEVTPTRRRRLFWRYPLMPLQVIALIHWQALRLFVKRQRFFARPQPLAPDLTATAKITDLSSPGHAEVIPIHRKS